MESFKVDVQTLYDLNIFAETENSESLFKMLDFTKTPGGKDKLKQSFRKPYSEINQILAVQYAVKFLQNNPNYKKIPVNKEIIDTLEMYFYNKTLTISSSQKFGSFFETFFLWFKGWSKIKKLMWGVKNTIDFIVSVKKYLVQLNEIENAGLLGNIANEIDEIVSDKCFKELFTKDSKDFKSFELLSIDKKFRETEREKVSLIFDKIYELDKLISMSKANEKFGLCTPEFISNEGEFEIKDFYHLFLQEPVKNDLKVDNNNLVFLTGPNMAGKTTMLKSLGVIICLAHTGMGVPASRCMIPVYNGLFSSVNTTDNLFKGYSYFYSEVLRVKSAAEFLNETNGKAFLIFDELFKGTNVKDAFDCSLMVIDGLVKWKNSLVILSSHLLELGTTIEKYDNVIYRHFDSEVIDGKPKFSFKLVEGLSDERLGLLILQNEKISALLDPTY